MYSHGYICHNILQVLGLQQPLSDYFKTEAGTQCEGDGYPTFKFTALPFRGVLVHDGGHIFSDGTVDEKTEPLIRLGYEKARMEGNTVTGFHTALHSKGSWTTNGTSLSPSIDQNGLTLAKNGMNLLKNRIASLQGIHESMATLQSPVESRPVCQEDVIQGLRDISNVLQLSATILSSGSVDMWKMLSETDQNANNGRKYEGCTDYGIENSVREKIRGCLENVLTMKHFVECRPFAYTEKGNPKHYNVFICSSTTIGAFKSTLLRPTALEIVSALLKIAQVWCPLPNRLMIDDRDTYEQVKRLFRDTCIEVVYYRRPGPEELEFIPQLDLEDIEKAESLLR